VERSYPVSTPRPRSVTDRLDALRHEFRAGLAELRAELKTDIAGLRTELKTDIGGLRAELKTDIGALTGEFREFKGTVRGAAIVIATLVPLVTAIAVVIANLLVRHFFG
jgi:hypothetical protein